MPLEDLLAGAALFAVMLAAVAAATALVVHRRLRHLDGLELTLASVVVGTALLLAVHLVPLMLGVLARGTVLAAAALAVGLALLVRPAGGGERPTARERRAAAPPSGRISWALAALASAYAAAAALANLGRWGGDEVIGDDPTSFHLPGVARWIQDGTLWKTDQFVPLLAQGYYPNNGDVVLLSTVLPWHNDFLVRLPPALFLATTAVAVFAVARELRAPHAASVLAAAAIVSLPVVGFVTIPRALPDSIMWTTFACGVLFLLRHARSARRSDLVLAGVALGIAAGTKWYGVSSVPVLLAVWLVARLVAARRGAAEARPAAVLRDGTVVGALALSGMLVWLLRNLTQSGNPVFPLNVELLGVTIFGAPRDVVRDEVGFSIADYAGKPDVLLDVGLKVVEGLGSVPLVCAIGLVAVAVLARRRGRAPDRRVLVMAAAALGLALLYTVTPATALGLRDTPSLAHANTRYAIPALIVAVAALAWAAGRLPPLAGRALEAALALGALLGAHEGYQVVGLRDVVAAAIALAVLGGAAWLLWRERERARRAVLVAAALGFALVGLAAADRMQDRINDSRYRSFDPALSALLDAAPSDKRIGLAFATYWSLGDLSPVWPAFGARLGNEVEFVGEFVDGFLTPYPDAAEFREALRHGGYDLLVIGRSAVARQNTPAQEWAIGAGWRTIALSARMRVLVPPA